MTKTPRYIMGTGLSHDGSACILKHGRIAVAIEKERITRIKHDGGNDAAAVQYCLDALGIQLSDIDLIVQTANFEQDIEPERYAGKRIYHPDVQIITISHHLAHAYSAIATSPFKESNVLVIDGAGSPANYCDDWPDEAAKQYWQSQERFYCEKDSFYRYDSNGLTCLYKDFSEVKAVSDGRSALRMPVTYHSIGGLYAAASHYCFGNMDDVGKLMGLAPYGHQNEKNEPLFLLENGQVMVVHESLSALKIPAGDFNGFTRNFQHYADVAKWVQTETERAVAYVVKCRQESYPHENLCYAGGVALNAVSNARLLKKSLVENLYVQPAAGDNGLAIGCAYYGWHQTFKQEMMHQPALPVYYGMPYKEDVIERTLCAHPEKERLTWHQSESFVSDTAEALAQGKVIGWFQGGSEFGPRALGHRSILADPRVPGIRQHINSAIKFREDFRPFAPAVLSEEVSVYFQNGWESPYMILVDDIRDEWRAQLHGVVHVDGTCRVQTVNKASNPDFHQLITCFKAQTGIGLMVNTSFNRKGMPIVETPQEAIDFFLACALDLCVIGPYLISKKVP